ncbi:efflux RND transporter periplasmic adaptor subunit [Microbacteriaceae bacterium K1510]|nr:efflux RND transporter periplasmic adaptor subunit [Microbacteriaceae bacterium K1510]
MSGCVHLRRAAIPVGLLLALAACGQSNTYVPPPPPKVTVATPEKRPVTIFLETTGSSAAVNSANLVARVAGFITSVNYKDGDFVKKGQLLFTIEPDSYELKFKQAQAAQAAAEATLRQAQADFERQTDLASRGTASKATLDTSTANRDNAQANLQQAQVNTKLAEINYGYTSVTAPFDGVVSARTVSVGEYVGASSQPTVLATIVQLDPIYVNFSVNERDVLRIREQIRERGLTPEDLRRVPVEVGLQIEQGYPHRGTLNYASPTVDSSTGTLAARGLFENASRVLLPGLFVRVRVPIEKKDDALLVPDVALGSDQSGRYVYVVNKDNIVEQRNVDIGSLEGTMRVINSGISADDRVIVAGLLRAIPGQKVDPQTAQPATPSAATKK